MGGSLNTVQAVDNCIVKTYKGQIQRGAEKLHNEYNWLLAVPSSVRKEYPLLYPVALKFNQDDTSGLTELQLSRLPRTSLTKAILRNTVTPTKAAQFVKISLQTLKEIQYPIRKGAVEPDLGYQQYHANRIALARKYLCRLPYMKPMLSAAQISVNSISCPSINQFLAWLDANWNKIFISTELVAFHGNYHPDNILVDPDDSVPNVRSISFIDPRGELLGFPHYDYAKILSALEAYYDEIHYGDFDIAAANRGNSYEIDLKVNETRHKHYQMCLESTAKFAECFSKIERVSKEKFLWLVYAAECIHILSFCFYHAYGPSPDSGRIKAFIATFALLSRRLFDDWDSGKASDVPKTRLSLVES